HALMRFRVHVDSLGDWDRWVASMNQPPPELVAGSAEARGAEVVNLVGGCFVCHTVQGTTAQGKIGPDLTLFGDRGTLASGIMENTDANLRAWVRDVRAIKPIPEGGTFMPTFSALSDQQIADVSSYLRSLKLR
ncbi:MAG: cytochrome c, partial [Dehalococcoidia bacterium]